MGPVRTQTTWMEDDSAWDVLLGLAQTFRELAAGVDAFGQLVRDEADTGRSTTPAEVQDLRAALEGLHEARARLEDLLMAGSGPELLQLHATVLSTVQRLLREMDLDERIRRQVRLMRPRPRLTRPGGPRRSSDSPPAPEPTPEAETQVLPSIPLPAGATTQASEPAPSRRLYDVDTARNRRSRRLLVTTNTDEQRHRRAGDHRVEQPGRGERHRGDVVGERPEQVALDRAQRAPGQPDRVDRGPQVAADQGEVAGLDRHVGAGAHRDPEVGLRRARRRR